MSKRSKLILFWLSTCIFSYAAYRYNFVMSAKCIFCKIIERTAPAAIQYETEELLIFNDIKPAAKNHFLVIPKKHYANAKSLTPEDKPLVENLVELGKKMLADRDMGLDDAVFGFHWPPFNSIQHLHMHVIAPASEMSFWSRNIFKPDSFWFVTPEYLLERLSKNQNVS